MMVGPTVTRYELELGPGVKVSPGHQPPQGHRLRDGVARRAHPGSHPGRQAIGVEIPNADRKIVAVGDILTSPEAVKAKHPLEVAVGRDINGKVDA